MNPSPATQIAYVEARKLIHSGDIVFIKNGYSLGSRLTQFITASTIYHTGIAFWVTGPNSKPHLLILESHQGGRRIVTLSSYARHDIEVIESPIDWESHGSAFLEQTGVVKYSILEYLAIGMRELLCIPISLRRSYEVCSKLVALYLRSGRILVEDDISPGLLYRTLVSQKHKTRCSIKALQQNRKRSQCET